jgi:hypothetical protein
MGCQCGQENVVKAGLSGVFLGDFNLAYERMLSSNRSLQFKAGYLNPVTSPFFTEEAITPEAYSLYRKTVECQPRWNTGFTSRKNCRLKDFT